MAHEISTVTVKGKAIVEAMYANKPAWHDLGTIFDIGGDTAPTSEEAMKLAHLDWEVALEHVYIGSPEEVEVDASEEVPCDDVVEDWFAVVRQEPRKALGMVGTQYEPLQNRDAFAFMDSLCREHEIRYEAAMALRGGRQVALLARMPSIDVAAKGDHLLRYVLLSNSHDGSSAITLTPTSVRVVCANTLRLAMSRDGGKSFSIRHTAAKDDKMEQARSYLMQFDDRFTSFAAEAAKMAKAKITDAGVDEYLRSVYPAPPALEDGGTKASHTSWTKKIDAIRNLYTNGEHNNLPSIRGSVWSLFNALTEHIDHETKFRGANAADNRLKSTLMGELADVKDRAWAAAIQLI